ncbi:MAG: hypothetical protein ACJAR2_001982 [Ilumatobacter sp.]|jgi:hypothetical protein
MLDCCVVLIVTVDCCVVLIVTVDCCVVLIVTVVHRFVPTWCSTVVQRPDRHQWRQR